MPSAAGFTGCHRRSPRTPLSRGHGAHGALPDHETGNGYALSAFYQCPFVAYDEKRPLTAALLRGINLGHLKTHHWVPLQLEEHQVDILIDDPCASEKIQDIQRLFPGKTIRWMVGLREDILQYVHALSREGSPPRSPEVLTALLDQMGGGRAGRAGRRGRGSRHR